MNDEHAGRVFLSYRRSDSKHVAGRIYDRLVDRFGEARVFMDVDSIEAGDDFGVEIDRAVRRCAVLLAIIGPTWLSAADGARRRLDDPDDLVVLEIEAALRRNVLVIPVLVDDAAMPRRADLPEVLGGLARRNALRVSHERFGSSCGALVARVDRAFRALATPPDARAEQEGGEVRTGPGVARTPAPARPAADPSALDVRVGQVDDARIVERTHHQILTFSWPHGVDVVLVHVESPTGNAEEARRPRRTEEISQRQHEAQGGLYFRDRLPADGCSVRLEPVAYRGRRRVVGPVTSLDYPGLIRLGYRVLVEGDEAHRAVAVRLQILAESEHGEACTFAFVHNPVRFPLHERDGEVLIMHPVGDPRARPGFRFRPSELQRDPGGVHWRTSVLGRSGYLRLFVSLPPERRSSVALSDPPIGDLFLGATP